MQAAAAEHKWSLNFPSIATIWREGCIIRATILDPIRTAFEESPNLENLLFAPYFTSAITAAVPGWRRIVMSAAELGIPAPCLSTALTYFDSLRSKYLPANLLQAQRDYFGDHEVVLIDRLDQGPVHINWPELLRRQGPRG